MEGIYKRRWSHGAGKFKVKLGNVTFIWRKIREEFAFCFIAIPTAREQEVFSDSVLTKGISMDLNQYGQSPMTRYMMGQVGAKAKTPSLLVCII